MNNNLEPCILHNQLYINSLLKSYSICAAVPKGGNRAAVVYRVLDEPEGRPTEQDGIMCQGGCAALLFPTNGVIKALGMGHGGVIFGSAEDPFELLIIPTPW